jgi:hypothetical protein
VLAEVSLLPPPQPARIASETSTAIDADFCGDTADSLFQKA